MDNKSYFFKYQNSYSPPFLKLPPPFWPKCFPHPLLPPLFRNFFTPQGNLRFAFFFAFRVTSFSILTLINLHFIHENYVKITCGNFKKVYNIRTYNMYYLKSKIARHRQIFFEKRRFYGYVINFFYTKSLTPPF